MQIHNRLDAAQIKLFLSWYVDKKITLREALFKLGIKERRFFYLVKLYRNNKLETIGKRIASHNKISSKVEKIIKEELEKEQAIIHNKHVPVNKYNYAFVTNEVIEKSGTKVSAETVRKRALQWGFFVQNLKREKAHARIVLTEKPGVLLQHDSSHHLFAPASGVKWFLITTIDDFSRKILCAKLVEEETTWEHIKAVRFVCSHFGIPQNYYADNHSIFRFVARTDSYWRVKRKSHQDVVTKWEACLKALNIGIIHAMSPQAKGKVERPYRWIQDHLVRICAKRNITNINDAQQILNEDIFRYNAKTVHSTTGEIPDITFNRAIKEGNSAFRKLEMPPPFRSIDDIFCLREPRKVDGYQSISWNGRYFKVPKHIPIGSTVILHIIPDPEKPMIKIWFENDLLDTIFMGPTNKIF